MGDQNAKECCPIVPCLFYQPPVQGMRARRIFLERGIPVTISPNGPELLATVLKLSQQVLGENGYCGSFNGKLRDKPLNGKVFTPLKEIGGGE